MNHADLKLITEWLVRGSAHSPEMMGALLSGLHLAIDDAQRAVFSVLLDADMKFVQATQILDTGAIMERIQSLWNSKIGAPLGKIVDDILTQLSQAGN
jgi:hypothetical protein